MNVPPKTFIRVSHEDLRALVSKIGQAAGLPKDRADQLAEMLTGNDLRGVFSHGTQQIVAYARLMQEGQLNASPRVEVVQETAASLLVDGDGGLGYFPAAEGTQRVIEKARSQGIAVMLTRNHGHFGAAGLYSRMAVKQDLMAFVTSGHQLSLSPGDPVFNAAGGSPMSFCVPAGEEDALVLDFGAMHDLYSGSPHRGDLAKLSPGLVFRCIGMGAICQTWGGLLAGVPLDAARANRRFPGATQGSMLIAFRIDLFLPVDQFKREMDEYVRRVATLKPLEGFERAYLPGGLEAERERAWRQEGIPVGQDHRERLEKTAGELAISVPWRRG